MQAQSQKVAKVNELASLRTDLKHERAENMVLREKLCEICLQLDEMATAKEAGEEEHSMTEQVHVVPQLLHCFCFATMECISSRALGGHRKWGSFSGGHMRQGQGRPGHCH